MSICWYWNYTTAMQEFTTEENSEKGMRDHHLDNFATLYESVST